MQHTRLIDYIGEVETDPERHIVRACRQCPESLADPISRAVSAGTLFLFDLDKNAELLPLVKRNVIAHVGPKGHDYNL